MWVVIALFVTMLFINVYFRVKVIKHFRNITRAGVEFGAKHVFNQTKLESEVIPHYPESADDILAFAKHLRMAMKLATILFVLICLIGWILMKWR
jgi:hypothetical protein